ncbi:MAG: hypothetical protein J6386_05220 [Candidatus Synoicihabitans palmerolidicus]|nr:hypothetical protein [Candidatus Synoicihabitans palmerolidicus]
MPIERSRSLTEREQSQLMGVAELMENPRFWRAMVAHQRTMLNGRFGTLFKRLDLTSEELEVLRGLLIEKQNSALDVLMVSRGELGGTMNGNEVREVSRRAREEIDELIRQNLGDERFAEYRAFENSLSQRATVAQLVQRLSYSDSQMQPAQVEAMVDWMVASGGAVQPERPGISIMVNTEDPQAVPIVQATEPIESRHRRSRGASESGAEADSIGSSGRDSRGITSGGYGGAIGDAKSSRRDAL